MNLFLIQNSEKKMFRDCDTVSRKISTHIELPLVFHRFAPGSQILLLVSPQLLNRMTIHLQLIHEINLLLLFRP